MTRTASSTITACWGRRRLWRNTTGTNRIIRFANPLQRSLRTAPSASRSECKLPQRNGGKNLSPPKVGGTSDCHTICRDPAVAGRPSTSLLGDRCSPYRTGSTAGGRAAIHRLLPKTRTFAPQSIKNQPTLVSQWWNTPHYVNILLSSTLYRPSQV